MIPLTLQWLAEIIGKLGNFPNFPNDCSNFAVQLEFWKNSNVQNDSFNFAIKFPPFPKLI